MNQEQKRQQWEAIKTEAPEAAAWLSDMSKAFGKVAAMSVVLESGETIESGLFSRGMNFDNGVKK